MLKVVLKGLDLNKIYLNFDQKYPYDDAQDKLHLDLALEQFEKQSFFLRFQLLRL